jgi:hypothetical protein
MERVCFTADKYGPIDQNHSPLFVIHEKGRECLAAIAGARAVAIAVTVGIAIVDLLGSFAENRQRQVIGLVHRSHLLSSLISPQKPQLDAISSVEQPSQQWQTCSSRASSSALSA